MTKNLLVSPARFLLRRVLNNKAEFETLIKNSLDTQQTDEMKRRQKGIPQITARLEQIDKVVNKLYEDYALGNIEQDRHQQLTKKYSEEYYSKLT